MRPQAYPPRKFSPCARAECPADPVFTLHEKLRTGQTLRRQEKDTLASHLYGTFGQQRPVYQIAGWQVSFVGLLPEFVVQDPESGWYGCSFYAPDKTALRRALYAAKSYRIVQVLPESRGRGRTVTLAA